MTVTYIRNHGNDKKVWLIRFTLQDLGLHPNDPEYQAIYTRAIGAMDILSKKELVNLIEELYN